jgi:hypothetical protein
MPVGRRDNNMIITAILTTLTLMTSNVAGELVGTTVPPFPNDLVSRSGACIADSRGVERICDYAIGIVEDSKGEPQMLVSKRFSHRTGPKNTFWIVTDVVEYPTVPRGYELVIANCRNKGKLDPTISAVVRIVEREWLTNATWARRFDMELEKFVEIPTAGIECENPDTGDE